jgi:hypothetical protein
MELKPDGRSINRHWKPVNLGHGVDRLEVRQPRMKIHCCCGTENFAGSRLALTNVAESLVAEGQVQWLLTVMISAINGIRPPWRYSPLHQTVHLTNGLVCLLCVKYRCHVCFWAMTDYPPLVRSRQPLGLRLRQAGTPAGA